MQHGIEVALAPQTVFTIGNLPITNTLLTSWVVVGLLIIIAAIVGRRAKIIPGHAQIFFETIITFVYDYVVEILENEKLARRFFPFLLTLFLFIATSNILEFTPGIGSVGFFHGDTFTPLFRSVNTDLNVTLSLTLISVILIEITGVMVIGFFRYASKFINFSSPLGFAVGLIELVSESARLVSFSFRLFGNIFAGEVLIAVASYFVPYVLPVPLMAFEMFIGFVQAAIFPLLALFFIKLAVTDPHGDEHESAESGHAQKIMVESAHSFSK
jgi:F-type H+-transporting ATPase subunit a